MELILKAFLEPLRYLIRELHDTAESICAASGEPEDLRRGVLMFMANGLQTATDLTRVSNERVAGWLTVRTLWHNTACLAMFVLDPRGHRTIARLLDLDCDLRAADILVDEPIRIMGGKEAKLVFKNVAFDHQRIVESAQAAQAEKPREGEWKSVRVSDLQTALRRLCDDWKESPGIARQLRTLIKQADMGRTRGDAISHPNLFGIQTLLQVVNLDEGSITLDSSQDANEMYLKQITSVHLLLLHAAVLARRFPSSIDFPGLFEEAQGLLSVDPDEPEPPA